MIFVSYEDLNAMGSLANQVGQYRQQQDALQRSDQINQWGANAALQQGQFQQTFGENVRQFDTGQQFRERQFGADERFRWDQSDWNKNLQAATFADQQARFGTQMAADNSRFAQQLAENQRQFNVNDQFRSGTTVLDENYRRDQMGQQAYQFDQNYGLNRDQFTDQRQRAAAQMGIQQSQFELEQQRLRDAQAAQAYNQQQQLALQRQNQMMDDQYRYAQLGQQNNQFYDGQRFQLQRDQQDYGQQIGLLDRQFGNQQALQQQRDDAMGQRWSDRDAADFQQLQYKYSAIGDINQRRAAMQADRDAANRQGRFDLAMAIQGRIDGRQEDAQAFQDEQRQADRDNAWRAARARMTNATQQQAYDAGVMQRRQALDNAREAYRRATSLEYGNPMRSQQQALLQQALSAIQAAEADLDGYLGIANQAPAYGPPQPQQGAYGPPATQPSGYAPPATQPSYGYSPRGPATQPSYDSTPRGQYYRAPDGSMRLKR